MTYAHGSRQRRNTLAVVLGLAVLVSTGCTTTDTTTARPAGTQWDGLARREVRGLDEVYVRPDVNFGVYRTVMIDPVQIAFDRNWDPNRNQRDLSLRLSPADIQSIKDDMARNFREVFIQELSAGGYEVVAQPTAETLRIVPSLADVYINAPDAMLPAQMHSFTLEAGEMTLVLEARDGPTGQLLARVVDEDTGHPNTYLQLTNEATNTMEFRRACRAWAKQLRAGLDGLNGKQH